MIDINNMNTKINVLTYKASNYVWYETGLNGIGTKEQND